MPDTVRDFLENEECSDCGKKEVVFEHWGLLVQPGDIGKFCAECWALRKQSGKSGQNAEPLGYRKAAAGGSIEVKA